MHGAVLGPDFGKLLKTELPRSRFSYGGLDGFSKRRIGVSFLTDEGSPKSAKVLSLNSNMLSSFCIRLSFRI